jgi:hypothetical protein
MADLPIRQCALSPRRPRQIHVVPLRIPADEERELHVLKLIHNLGVAGRGTFRSRR